MNGRFSYPKSLRDDDFDATGYDTLSVRIEIHERSRNRIYSWNDRCFPEVFSSNLDLVVASSLLDA